MSKQLRPNEWIISCNKNNPKESGTINGNVMFEIGMAIDYNKPWLLIMNDSFYPFVKNNQNKNSHLNYFSHDNCISK